MIIQHKTDWQVFSDDQGEQGCCVCVDHSTGSESSSRLRLYPTANQKMMFNQPEQVRFSEKIAGNLYIK